MRLIGVVLVALLALGCTPENGGQLSHAESEACINGGATILLLDHQADAATATLKAGGPSQQISIAANASKAAASLHIIVATLPSDSKLADALSEVADSVGDKSQYEWDAGVRKVDAFCGSHLAAEP